MELKREMLGTWPSEPSVIQELLGIWPSKQVIRSSRSSSKPERRGVAISSLCVDDTRERRSAGDAGGSGAFASYLVRFGDDAPYIPFRLLDIVVGRMAAHQKRKGTLTYI